MSASRREDQKRERRERIYRAALALFAKQGFEASTISAIARSANVSRGTVFNYFPYKEAFLLEYFGRNLRDIAAVAGMRQAKTPLEPLRLLFDKLAGFVEANRHLVLPLSYELLNPDPERSRQAYTALPLTAILQTHLAAARASGLIRSDFSLERLARMLANTFFLTCLQWAAYRQDRSIREELHLALLLTLGGLMGPRAEAAAVLAHD